MKYFGLAVGPYAR